MNRCESYIYQHGHNDGINLPVWGSPGRARSSLLMLDKVPSSLYALRLHVLLSFLASFLSAQGTFDLCSFHEWTFLFFLMNETLFSLRMNVWEKHRERLTKLPLSSLPCSQTTGQSQTSRVTHAKGTYAEKKTQHSGRLHTAANLEWKAYLYLYIYIDRYIDR